MKIYVIDAQDLIPPTGVSFCNTYTSIYFGMSKSRTETVGGTESPVWNEVLALYVYNKKLVLLKMRMRILMWLYGMRVDKTYL